MALKTGAVAIPLVLVTAVAVADPLKLALAPETGAVKATVTPPSGLPPASLTMACSSVANALPTSALCGVPATTEMLAGVPPTLLKEKMAAGPAAAAVADTVYEPA